MTHYKIAICEDEAGEAAALAEMVSAWAAQANCAAEITTFPSAEAFLFAHGSGNPFDILLLDVEMRLVSGIELAKRIRESDRRAEIIFVTSHAEFIGEGYEVDALHYLLKPVRAEKLSAVLVRAARKLAAEPAAVVIVRDGETRKLPEDDILYVEAFLHYIAIHTLDGEYKIKENISAFERKLSARFFRVHRSYIASLSRVVRISRTSVTLEGGAVLPLSRGLYERVNRAFIEQN